MFTTIITDCKEENEAGRQIARFNSLNLGPTSLIGVDSSFGDIATIEAGANLIDILDATEGKKGVIVVNVAPRGDKSIGENGNSFCYFYYKKTLVISTVAGYTLSFIRNFKVANKVKVLEVQEVLEFMVKNNQITKQLKNHITNSQFRSFDFVSRVARWLIDRYILPSSLVPIAYSLMPSCVWCIDAFGNAKLTLINQKIKKIINEEINTNLGAFNYYERLKDIPKGETAIYTGSSGLGDIRFLEIA